MAKKKKMEVIKKHLSGAFFGSKGKSKDPTVEIVKKNKMHNYSKNFHTKDISEFHAKKVAAEKGAKKTEIEKMINAFNKEQKLLMKEGNDFTLKTAGEFFKEYAKAHFKGISEKDILRVITDTLDHIKKIAGDDEELDPILLLKSSMQKKFSIYQVYDYGKNTILPEDKPIHYDDYSIFNRLAHLGDLPAGNRNSYSEFETRKSPRPPSQPSPRPFRQEDELKFNKLRQKAAEKQEAAKIEAKKQELKHKKDELKHKKEKLKLEKKAIKLEEEKIKQEEDELNTIHGKRDSFADHTREYFNPDEDDTQVYNYKRMTTTTTSTTNKNSDMYDSPRDRSSSTSSIIFQTPYSTLPVLVALEEEAKKSRKESAQEERKKESDQHGKKQPLSEESVQYYRIGELRALREEFYKDNPPPQANNAQTDNEEQQQDADNSLSEVSTLGNEGD